MFNTPILFIIFNRPKQTRIVFDVIRQIQPKYLFVAADGPRANNDTDQLNCTECRKIVETIDWDCEVQFLFREENAGCRLAVSGAISWFFNNIEQGIILEDDCLPNKSFFYFCEELLLKYKEDSRIMHIGGANFQAEQMCGFNSYYFSKIVHVWGWASWKRAWNVYDIEMRGFSANLLRQWFKQNSFPKTSFSYWLDALTKTKNNLIDTWDYQWAYSIWKNKGICITPTVNLISNIGFDNNATHTSGNSNAYANLPVFDIIEIHHPEQIEINKTADNYIFNTWYRKRNLIERILRRIKNLFD